MQILAQIEPFVYEWTSKNRGSISAEHGIGLMKANNIHYSKSAETASLMLYEKVIAFFAIMYHPPLHFTDRKLYN